MSSPEERRITLRLLAYWEKRRAGRSMPVEADIDPADVADLWDDCFIARVRDAAAQKVGISYLGRELKQLYQEVVEERDGEPTKSVMQALAPEYPKILAKAMPLVTEGELRTLQGDLLKYRQVLLPLGEGASVQAIFGGMRVLRLVAYR